MRKVSGETVVPLGFGEGIDDPGVFQALLREGLIDMVRPEISIFGISGARRIAALAEPYYVAVAPRHTGGGPSRPRRMRPRNRLRARVPGRLDGDARSGFAATVAQSPGVARTHG